MSVGCYMFRRIIVQLFGGTLDSLVMHGGGGGLWNPPAGDQADGDSHPEETAPRVVRHLLYSAPTKQNPTNGYLLDSTQANTRPQANLKTKLLYFFCFFWSSSGRATKLT